MSKENDEEEKTEKQILEEEVRALKQQLDTAGKFGTQLLEANIEMKLKVQNIDLELQEKNHQIADLTTKNDELTQILHQFEKK